MKSVMKNKFKRSIKKTGVLDTPKIYKKDFSNFNGKIDVTSLPSVREFERRLRDTGTYSRNKAKFFASMYGKQRRLIEQDQNGWDGQGNDVVEAVENLIKKLKNRGENKNVRS